MIDPIASHPWALNSFDVNTELLLNHLAHRSALVDWLVYHSDTPIAHGAVLMFLLWWAMFDGSQPRLQRKGNEMLVASLLFSTFGIFLVRILAAILPFRPRPLAVTSVGFGPWPSTEAELFHWSAFPSDHACLFTALAFGIFLVSPRLGRVAIAWTIFVILLPRLYLGYHWPTDLLAGAILGLACGFLAKLPAIRNISRKLIDRSLAKSAGLFYAFLFLWTWETANMFGDVRLFVNAVLHRHHS